MGTWAAGERWARGREVSKLSVLLFILTDIEVTGHRGWRHEVEHSREQEASRCPKEEA